MEHKQLIKECIDARNLIFESVKRELLGPGSEPITGDIEHEIITEPPITRYSTGMLYPKQVQNDESILQEDMIESSSNEDDIDSIEFNNKIGMSNELKPSSIGITFFAQGDRQYLNVRVKAARYRKTDIKDIRVKYNGYDFFIGTIFEDYIERNGEFLRLKKEFNLCIKDYIDGQNQEEEYKKYINIIYKLQVQYKESYIRESINFLEIIRLDVKLGYSKKCLDDNKIELGLYTKKYKNNINSYTVVLINNQDNPSYGRDFATIFQPKIIINSSDNNNMKFVESRNPLLVNDEIEKSDEEVKLELLYSKRKNYSVGHGVSTSQNINLESGLGTIETEFVPLFNIKGISFDIDRLDKDKSDEVLSMKGLSDISNISKGKVIANLEILPELYQNWIDDLNNNLRENFKYNKEFNRVGQKIINECEVCLRRVKKGISILRENDLAYYAFNLMNRALYMQRVQGLRAEKDRYHCPDEVRGEMPAQDFDGDLLEEGITEPKWRPFQLAYILMCIESIVDPNSEDREIVDLIWVPTGGGKTEAYLGLTAFTIFYRRLNNKSDAGTTVIMRYTLRLLAAQQFSRASILICACELIRRELENELGDEPITIGLWIGSEQTPNTRKEATSYFKNLKDSKVSNLNFNKEQYNKFQVLKCPWCGTLLEKGIKNVKGKQKEVGGWGYCYTAKEGQIFCPEDECEFNEIYGLPIQVVDELIYEKPPTLLFGTVDKFAMISMTEGAGKIFGIGTDYSSPSLIIQDELHLISGTLGSIVGNYETAIDLLCSEKGERPKIIASTATIKNAREQCIQLYAREMKQFPPSGLFEDDSFFIKEDKKSIGRNYVGIMPSGKTLTTTQVRLMATLSNEVKSIDSEDEVKSEYCTLVGYFNTIKELGMTRSLIPADITNSIASIAKRNLTYRHNLYNIEELTSRVTSSKINNTLKNLKIGLLDTNKELKIYPIDVLLASNMISVGVDVSRLNLMMILQQPKLTSEYIQASSRVGRDKPGIIFTLYNPSRSRDKSYYELFYDYHNSYYKYVEPTSVTSFTAATRERMIHSVFVALIRHCGAIYDEKAAVMFNELDESLIDRHKRNILSRMEWILRRSISSEDLIGKELKEAEQELNDFIDKWKVKSEGNEELKYTYRINAAGENFLLKPFGIDKKIDGRQTLQSMRNVDQQGYVRILIEVEDDE